MPVPRKRLRKRVSMESSRWWAVATIGRVEEWKSGRAVDYLGEVLVAEAARGLLDTLACGGSLRTRVERGHMAGHPIALGHTPHEGFVAGAVAGAQVEIAVGYLEGYARTVEEVGHHHRVAAAANGQQHLLPLGEEVLLNGIVDEALQHHLTMSLRIWRWPSTTIP